MEIWNRSLILSCFVGYLTGSPCAVSNCADLGRSDAVYSLATSPGVQPTRSSSLSDDKSSSKMQPRMKLDPVYAVVAK